MAIRDVLVVIHTTKQRTDSNQVRATGAISGLRAIFRKVGLTVTSQFVLDHSRLAQKQSEKGKQCDIQEGNA